jgi:hypothetical protein
MWIYVVQDRDQWWAVVNTVICMWIYVAQDRDQWWAVVSTVMNHQIL